MLLDPTRIILRRYPVEHHYIKVQSQAWHINPDIAKLDLNTSGNKAFNRLLTGELYHNHGYKIKQCDGFEGSCMSYFMFCTCIVPMNPLSHFVTCLSSL